VNRTCRPLQRLQVFGMLRAMQTSMSIAPRHRSLQLSLLGLGLVALATGCAYGEMRQVVRAQFAAELSCPEVTVEARKPYDEQYVDGQYRATGCGVTRTYTCPADAGLVSYDENACTFVDGDLVKAKAPPAPKPQDDMGESDPMMDEPAAEPEPEPAPAKTKSKSGKVGPKPSGKFKIEADTSAGIEAGDVTE
jgi:hypothetical protein